VLGFNATCFGKRKEHNVFNFRLMVSCIVSIYVYKYPTRCNSSILVLLQDHSACFGHFPHTSSGVQFLQLTVTGITYVTIVHNRAVGHITTIMWPTARFWTILKVDVTTKFTIQRIICYTGDSQLQLLYS
jgi:hypothetical protein